MFVEQKIVITTIDQTCATHGAFVACINPPLVATFKHTMATFTIRLGDEDIKEIPLEAFCTECPYFEDVEPNDIITYVHGVQLKYIRIIVKMCTEPKEEMDKYSLEELFYVCRPLQIFKSTNLLDKVCDHIAKKVAQMADLSCKDVFYIAKGVFFAHQHKPDKYPQTLYIAVRTHVKTVKFLAKVIKPTELSMDELCFFIDAVALYGWSEDEPNPVETAAQVARGILLQDDLPGIYLEELCHLSKTLTTIETRETNITDEQWAEMSAKTNKHIVKRMNALHQDPVVTEALKQANAGGGGSAAKRSRTEAAFYDNALVIDNASQLYLSHN